MKALVLLEPNKLTLQERPAPTAGPAEAVVAVKAAAICHTDLFTLAGRYPGTKYPTVMGHEFSGVVEQCGEGVSHLKPGDRVTALGSAYCGTCPACRRGQHNACEHIRGIPFHMDGGFQEKVGVPATMVFPVADSVSFAEAALAEPAANGYATADRTDICPRDHVVVIGPGPIGLLALQAAKLKSPQSLTMLGTRPERLALAAELGATGTVNVRETDPCDAVMDITAGHGADAVLLCAGTEDAWDVAGRIVAHSGRVAVEALPPTADTRWPVNVFDFTAKAVGYVGVSGYTASQFQTALRLIESQAISVAPLITHRFPLESYDQAFRTSEERIGGAVKVLFEMNRD